MKARWREVLLPEFMSTEESGQEECEDGRSHSVFYVKPIPWRHPQVSKFFRQMVSRVEKHKSRRSMDRMLPRRVGQQSSRSKLPNFPPTFWAYVES